MTSPAPLGAPTITTTELNHRTTAVLARVQQGETLVITWHGVVVAQLVPTQPHPLARLVVAGLLHPAPRPSGFPAQPRPLPPVRPSLRR